MGTLTSYFTFLSIFIGCLGLIGLSAFIAEKRTKEIGIRKVLGASSGRIVQLLSKEFLLLVSIANIAAWPIAYIFMNRWLTNFAYSTNLRFRSFVIAGVVSFGIAFVTVSLQALYAARKDPVRAIKYE